MYYVILTKQPVVYISGENEDILKSDYYYIQENPGECELRRIPEFSGKIEFTDFQLLTPSEFTKTLDEIGEGKVYTYRDGKLVIKYYKKAPYFYLDQELVLPYDTYCNNKNSIKAGILNNDELINTIEGIFNEYAFTGEATISSEPPEGVTDTVAYVCVPININKIPIGVETEEEKADLIDDSEDDDEEFEIDAEYVQKLIDLTRSYDDVD